MFLEQVFSKPQEQAFSTERSATIFMQQSVCEIREKESKKAFHAPLSSQRKTQHSISSIPPRSHFDDILFA